LKVEDECAACIISRGTAMVKEATTNPALRFRAICELLRLLTKEFRPTAVPADLGTKRDRLIRRITGSSDPYKRQKRISNEKALRLLPYARKFTEEGYTQQDRFKRAVLVAIVGNIIEFDIPGHKASFSSLKKNFREAAKDLIVDDIDKIYEMAKKAHTILFLTDNAGEIVFDTLLVEKLKETGASVIVAVKGGPVVNDATLEDADASGMSAIADKVITTGTDAVGFAAKEIAEEFLDASNSADLIIAKGMGYAETLTEHKLKKPHALLLRSKCNPVANYFCVPHEKNVAKLMP
jgi:uncharacterized protein with ATP-grasp and redox domains